MQVTKIESVTKTKFKVYLEEQFAFVLYKGELSRFKIQEGAELSQETVNQIKNEVLVKRVKLRAMYLLNQMDRTEEQLRTKLKKDLYTDDLIAIAMAYVKSFGYIGDYNYAKRFVETKSNSKSKAEIKMLLLQKGVSKEIIEEALESYYSDTNEGVAIQRILEKKRFSAENATDLEKKKMMEYLMRKGFHYDEIRQVIQVSLWNA